VGPSVWATDSANGRLLQIDPAGGLIADVPTGRSAESIVFGAGSVWVVSFDEGAVLRVDPASRRVEALIPVGEGPLGAAYAAGRVFVGRFRDGTVGLIDPATNRVAAEVPVGPEITGLAASGDSVAVAVAGEQRVAILNGDGIETASFDLPGRPAEIAAAGSLVAVSLSDDGIVAVIDLGGGPTREISIGGVPGSLAFGFGRLWVADPVAGVVRVLMDPTRSTPEDPVIVALPGAAAVDTSDDQPGEPAVFVGTTAGGSVWRLDPTELLGPEGPVLLYGPGEGSIFAVAYGGAAG
jgi:YVTN family beta-propeller protein